jgi:hypothetical protein
MLSTLSLDILSAIMFSIVLIHLALTPTFESIRRPQKNLARALPTINFLLVCRVQFGALVLSVIHRVTGCGLSLIFSSCKHDNQSTVVQYDCHILETIDGNDGLI